MNLKKVHHIAIIGSNYEQSKHFYVDLLGFSIIRENYRPVSVCLCMLTTASLLNQNVMITKLIFNSMR